MNPEKGVESYSPCPEAIVDLLGIPKRELKVLGGLTSFFSSGGLNPEKGVESKCGV